MNNDYGLAEKHKEVIYLLDEIDCLCRENRIKYSLHGGTLLGAERDGHLIPWDDDADISMMRSQFKKFKKIVESNNPSLLVIEKSEIAPWLTKIRFSKNNKSKVAIDIFVWDYITESPLGQTLKINLLRFLQGTLKKNIVYSEYKGIQKILVWIAYCWGLLFKEETKIRWYKKIEEEFLTGKKKYIHRSNDAFVGCSYIFDSDYMKSYSRINLEEHTYMVVKRYHEFLIRNYGEDYMTPPPETERRSQHGHNKGFLPKSERGGTVLIRR